MKRFLFILNVLLISCILICGGCATKPKPIPANYFDTETNLSVEVIKINPKPVMRDSGNGGLIGIIVNSSRGSNMKKQMEGIQGETVKELLKQQISNKMEEVFEIVDEKAQLSMEISIDTWGWFVPSTAFGIKTGSYQCEIIGSAKVYDQSGEKKEISYVRAVSQKPLGNDPTVTQTQEAVLQAVTNFAEQVTDFLLKNCPKD